jgi:hypothetical protein
VLNVNCEYGDSSQQVVGCDLLYFKGCGVLTVNCVYVERSQ